MSLLILGLALVLCAPLLSVKIYTQWLQKQRTPAEALEAAHKVFQASIVFLGVMGSLIAWYRTEREAIIPSAAISYIGTNQMAQRGENSVALGNVLEIENRGTRPLEVVSAKAKLYFVKDDHSDACNCGFLKDIGTAALLDSNEQAMYLGAADITSILADPRVMPKTKASYDLYYLASSKTVNKTREALIKQTRVALVSEIEVVSVSPWIGRSKPVKIRAISKLQSFKPTN